MRRTDTRRGMTLTEILAVVGIIIVLLAILLPGLQVVRRNGLLAKSQSNLRQVYTYLSGYASDNREFVVPSQFDYRNANYVGKVRTESPKGVYPLTGPIELSGGPVGGGSEQFLSVGTWTDILWAYADLPPIVLPWGAENPDDYNYRYDSPDRIVYQADPSFSNVFRSTEMMTKVKNGSEYTPFGTGAPRSEVGQPGYFAANDYLSVRLDPDDPDSGRWFSRGQIRAPDRSIYLVDSLAGETIKEDREGWGDPSQGFETEVDFRYIGNNALLLTMEGGIKTEPKFDGLEDMVDRGYRIYDLEKRVVDHSGSNP